jgi:hypothetical protein
LYFNSLVHIHLFLPTFYPLVVLMNFIILVLTSIWNYCYLIIDLYRWWCGAFWFTVQNGFNLTLHLRRVFWFYPLLRKPIVLGLIELSWSLDLIWAYSVYIFIKLPFLFTWISLLSFHTTWVLCVYFYRMYTDSELYPESRRYDLLGRYVWPFITYIQLKFLDYSVSKVTRVRIWNIIIENFNLTFFFLPRYYRLNDLMWQDGFLIDFLQKKSCRSMGEDVCYLFGLFIQREVFIWYCRPVLYWFCNLTYLSGFSLWV